MHDERYLDRRTGNGLEIDWALAGVNARREQARVLGGLLDRLLSRSGAGRASRRSGAQVVTRAT